jgi:ankyrin repeat protein
MRIKAVPVVVAVVVAVAAVAYAQKALPRYYAKRLLDRAGIELSSRDYIDAACRDDAGTVALMLAAGMDVNARAPDPRRNNMQTTALFCAASSGDAKLIDQLIARGAAVNATNEANETALFAAAYPSYAPFRARQTGFDAVAELLAKGAQIDAKSDNGTVLHAACRSGNMQLVNFLLDRGANPAIPDARGVPPLAVCATSTYNGASIPFDRLLVKGVNLDAVGADGATLLSRAVQRNDPEMLQKLLSLGANPNATDGAGDPPLIGAVRNMRLLTVLVDKGADVNHAGHDGTALVAALRMQSMDAAGYLISKGANPLVTDSHGNTPLHVAAQSVRTTAAIPMLLAAGALPDAANQEGNTPLHLAARIHNQAAVDALLAGGAKVNIKNYAGQTPLALSRAPWGMPPMLPFVGGGVGSVGVAPGGGNRQPNDLERDLIRHGGRQ